MLKEFKEFAMKGSVIDLAVGVIIGAAFGKIVESVVNDMIMPVIGRVVGGLDFSNYFVALKDIPPGTAVTLEAVKRAGVPVFAYGNFLTISINFVILAFIIFLLVRWINKLKRAQAAEPASAPAESRVDCRPLRGPCLDRLVVRFALSICPGLRTPLRQR